MMVLARQRVDRVFTNFRTRVNMVRLWGPTARSRFTSSRSRHEMKCWAARSAPTAFSMTTAGPEVERTQRTSDRRVRVPRYQVLILLRQ
jgi:hypothetical protein